MLSEIIHADHCTGLFERLKTLLIKLGASTASVGQTEMRVDLECLELITARSQLDL
jgi:hypothetical protein